ncbi:hypothetical protein [Clostridium felsineum]|uniref:Uncharacterized protein n=1 Tax=Clostridium felsineum TaxID=36839 RepID=A0A1S8L1L9_9CLOT|nr:hypothetical protein [Clostridium felsineum]MCR3758661.1 hypothetical protein [Clostridium felsineum]URZ09236.1 hypothetical protein CLROS_046520 [Clostridium felsineum]URZ13922.1 hypothetical protein CROST_047000 [Clostridium felsineum]URZ18533.1 hypothetical protein CLFE_046210 [Clostridium felsineum DSM 794]
MINKNTSITENNSKKPNSTINDIEELLQKDPTIQKAIKITKDNDLITKDFVDKTLSELSELISDENTEFNIKHGFQALAKCINYLGEGLCDSYEDFQNELAITHKLISEKVMQAIPSEDMENFSLRRLMILSGSLIDYVFWREALGDCVNREELDDKENNKDEK